MPYRELCGTDWETMALIWNEANHFGLARCEQAVYHALGRVSALLRASEASLRICKRVHPSGSADPLDGWRTLIELRDLCAPWRTEKLLHWFENEQNYLFDPATQRLATTSGTSRSFLFRDLAGPEWEGTPSTRLLKEMELGDQVIGARPIGPDLEAVLIFNREPAEEPFREWHEHMAGAALFGMGELCLAVARVHGLADARRKLTRRERQVLHRLLTGQSEKQLASDLGLTTGSAHQYVVALHRAFGLSSRAELMALWLGERGAPNGVVHLESHEPTEIFRPRPVRSVDSSVAEARAACQRRRDDE